MAGIATETPIQRIVGPDHLRAIGLVIAEWSYMEYVVGWSVAELAAGRSIQKQGDEPAARILVTGMEFRTALGLLGSLAAVRFPNDADAFSKITEKIRRLAGTRNTIAHARWHKGKRPGTIEALVFKAVGSLTAQAHAFTARELFGLAERIAAQRSELLDFLTSRGFWKKPEPPVAPLSQAARLEISAAAQTHQERDSAPPKRGRRARPPRSSPE